MGTEISAPATAPESERTEPTLLHRLIRLWPWLAALSSGVLLSLCFPGFKQGWLVWIALTPLICAVWFGGPRQGDGVLRIARHPFALGYVMGLVFFAVTFRWLSELAPLFQTPWLHGLPILLALYMALYPATWAWLITKLPWGERPFRSAWRNLGVGALGACSWTALEWTRGWLFSGWGWNGLGVALQDDLAMIQIVDLTGVLGLTWLVAFCNMMAVIVVRRIVLELGPQFLKGVRWEFSFTMALLTVVFSYGVRVLFKGGGETTPLQAVAIQPNIPQVEKFDPDSEDAILAQLDKLTGLAAILEPKPDLIVWPEAATPRGMFADEVNYRFVMDQVARGDFHLLFGTLDYELEPDKPESSKVYNAAMLLSDHGKLRSVYRKMHLVPFGEYLPFRPLLPQAIGNLVPGDLDAGTETSVLTLPKPKTELGVLICFEDTLGNLTRGFVQKGAQVLVNVTNDGWFGKSVAAEQHLANALFRAIESRRPLLRCANTGVTCLIDRDGRVNRGQLQLFEQGFARFPIAVPKQPELTFYTRHGDWVGHWSSVVVLGLIGTHFWNRRRRVAVRTP